MRTEATQISAFIAAVARVLCFTGLTAAHSLTSHGALVSDLLLPSASSWYLHPLLVFSPQLAAAAHVFEVPVVIAVFSYLRRNPQSCSFIKAAARGLLGLPVGAFLNASDAIVLSAPVGIKYCIVTIYWSLLMTLFTFVPAACVFGASKIDWQNVLSHSIYFTSTDVENYMISAPCHGAVIGAWLGAWPMPLLGKTLAVAGHLIGMVVSLVLFTRES